MQLCRAWLYALLLLAFCALIDGPRSALAMPRISASPLQLMASLLDSSLPDLAHMDSAGIEALLLAAFALSRDHGIAVFNNFEVARRTPLYKGTPAI